jgi:hypothetical protein
MVKLFYVLIILICFYIILGEMTGEKEHVSKFVKNFNIPNLPIIDKSGD